MSGPSSPIALTVPNTLGPGPWIDCSSLGINPEGQLDGGNENDIVYLETAAFSMAVIGKYICAFAGGQESYTLTSAGPQGTGSVAFGRAVRRPSPTGGSLTPGLSLMLASSNFSTVGPQGPAGSLPVRGTIFQAFDGASLLLPGSQGIAGVTTVAANGVNQILVTFTTPFGSANYIVLANWVAAGATAQFQPGGFNRPGDGRTSDDVMICLFDPTTGLPVDCDRAAVNLMIGCN